jgi:chorismate synthase
MGNSFGEIFKITTFGESHGPAIGVVIDGVPPGVSLSEADIQHDLDRRRPGQSKITTSRNESDKAKILSGVFDGKTTGTALAIIIFNEEQRSQDYDAIKNVFRPGHADHTYFMKYGIRDHRGGGRSSGRETAARVAAGAVAKKVLRDNGVNIVAYTLSIGNICAKKFDYSVIEKNTVRCPDPDAAELMVRHIEVAREKKDSVGGIVQAVVHGCPPGLGDPVFDKLTARLAYALMSIGSTRGVEFGTGFKSAGMTGIEHNDKMYMDGDSIRSLTNHAGGISGGISNGGDIVVRIAVKPTASIEQPQQTVTADGKDTTVETRGRHDPCICPRIVPVVEAMIAITILDRMMMQKMIEQWHKPR